MILFWVVSACSATLATCGVTVQRAGWLDRVVQFYKNAFVQDVHELAPIQIQASMERAPPGYTDSPEWNYGSVSRLLALLGASEAAAPVRRALRRALRPSQPTRRFISKQQSWNLFPSLGKNHPNEIYYDFNYYDYDETTVNPALLTELEDEDDAVVVLKNPVEARLPSARISVRLLREILEARAIAARKMPSTTRYSIAWVPMNKTGDNASAAESGAEGNGTTAAAGDGNDEATGGEGGGDGAGGDVDGGDGAATEGAGGDADADAASETNPTEEIQKLHGPPAKNKPNRVIPPEDVNMSPGLRKGQGISQRKGAKNIKNNSKPKNKVKSKSVTRKMIKKPKEVSKKGVKTNLLTKQ